MPGWVLWAPTLGLPWRRSREGAGSLIRAGPSLSLFGHLLILQHHVGDEHAWNTQTRKVKKESAGLLGGQSRTQHGRVTHTGGQAPTQPHCRPPGHLPSCSSSHTSTHSFKKHQPGAYYRQFAEFSASNSTGNKIHSTIRLLTESTTYPPTYTLTHSASIIHPSHHPDI